MTVELLQSDTPEEKEKKLQAFLEYRDKKSEEERQIKLDRIKKFFGVIKSDLDPLELQKKMRDEWD